MKSSESRGLLNYEINATTIRKKFELENAERTLENLFTRRKETANFMNHMLFILHLPASANTTGGGDYFPFGQIGVNKDGGSFPRQ